MLLFIKKKNKTVQTMNGCVTMVNACRLLNFVMAALIVQMIVLMNVIVIVSFTKWLTKFDICSYILLIYSGMIMIEK